jgi:AGZA family xanthine/uracil permease-like MFS transporter
MPAGRSRLLAYTVVQALGFSWQKVLAAILVAGVVFLVSTVVRLRQWLVDAIPSALRYSFAVGVGLFLTFIGMNQTGVVLLGNAGAPASAPILTAIFGFLVMAALMIRRFPAAILVGILAPPLWLL